MHDKDMGTLNIGLYSTVPDFLTCTNEYGHIDGISIPLVLLGHLRKYDLPFFMFLALQNMLFYSVATSFKNLLKHC